MNTNGVQMELIATRIPDYAMQDWIGYCRKRGLTQSEVMRRAIARYIEDDDTSTNAELAMASIISDHPRLYAPRG